MYDRLINANEQDYISIALPGFGQSEKFFLPKLYKSEEEKL